MDVETDQGTFVVCEESHSPESHVGAVWHRGQSEHPSGAKLVKGEEAKVAPLEEAEK